VPTYGYRCPQCSTDFDVWQRMSDPPGAACPTCGGRAQRLFFPAGIVFKGSGFYATDHRTGKSSDGGSSASSTAPSTDTGKTKPEKTAASGDTAASPPAAG